MDIHNVIGRRRKDSKVFTWKRPNLCRNVKRYEFWRNANDGKKLIVHKIRCLYLEESKSIHLPLGVVYSARRLLNFKWFGIFPGCLKYSNSSIIILISTILLRTRSPHSWTHFVFLSHNVNVVICLFGIYFINWHIFLWAYLWYNLMIFGILFLMSF